MELLLTNGELLFFFFGIALLYASVGFGGGSSYLAILALYSIDYLQIRAIALCCNLTVVGGGSIIFSQKKHIRWKKTLPLVSSSIPMAYLGGRIPIQEQSFFLLLSISLLLAAVLMLIKAPKIKQAKQVSSIWLAILIGGGIGFLAGIVGIGGGIFLAPLLHLINWDQPKQIAATASVFILLNSLAGLIGQLQQTQLSIHFPLLISLILAVFLGGQIGSRLAANRFSPHLLRIVTACLVLFVSLRILWKHI